MFGRSSWAVLGLAKESLKDFTTLLAEPSAMAAASQMAASAITRHLTADSLGINPFRAPRLDEEHPLSAEHYKELAHYATANPDTRATLTLSPEILACEGYSAGLEAFQIHPSMPWFGLWAVSNEWKDVSDLSSIKEHRSYALMDRPYKFLQAVDKKSVDQEALGLTAAVRKQVPVLLDFNDGRVYIENTNKKVIQAIAECLKPLGADLVPVAWTFANSNWPAEILNKLYSETQFEADFQKRAGEATRFKPNEIEKLEDKELESIVANFFSMTQMPSDLWIGISGPAHIALHDSTPPIAVRPATTATSLLHMTKTARIVSAAITFQERISLTSKRGGELTFRKDLLALDINDKINLTEAGAAMLRGFDLPSFRKDILREIRQTKQVPSLEQFWSAWLHEMGNAVRALEATFRDLLDIDGSQPAGILPRRAASTEELLATD